jgi:tRNA(adenine34) deaminase
MKPEQTALTQKSTDEFFMRHAIALAKQAEQIGEIPVGAVVVHNNRIIGQGYNQAISLNDPSAHAEMLAIRAAGKHLNNYRLIDCTLYVTLEPCAMCAGLLVHSRINRLVFATDDYKTGCAGSILNLINHEQMNHQINCSQGILQQECSDMLSDFFKRRRAEKKALKLAQKKG